MSTEPEATVADSRPGRTWLRPLVRLAASNLLVGLLLFVMFGGHQIAEVWAGIDRNSLVGLQSFVEQTVDPDKEDPTLYFDYVLPTIELPVWFGAIVLLTLFDLIRFGAGWAMALGAAALWRRTRR